MPIRHGGRLASRAFTWPRDHFCRSTRAPRRSWPTFLPISMPMTATSLFSFWDMACSFALGAPRQIGPLAGLEHGRTIPLAAVGGPNLLRCDMADYWITSLAVANSVSAMVRPSALAVLRLMTRSYREGGCNGRS